jgi:hypothetical protein
LFSNSNSRHVASTRSARLEIEIFRAYRGQSRHAPTHTTFIGLSLIPTSDRHDPAAAASSCPTGAHTHRAHGQLPVCLNVCRPTVCTLAGRRLSVLRLHPDYTYAVCLHLVCRLFSPDFCLNVRRAAIDNRHHALHSASPSCGRRHRLGYTYCSSQGLFRER